MREIAAAVIFLATATVIVARPPRVPEWLAASAGVAAMVAVGIESVNDVVRAAATQWDVLLFFAGLMTIIAVAEFAGFFTWSAALAARAAQGSSRRLFVILMIACAVITALLTNDAAALVMTPLVFSLASQLRLRPLPYALACTFVANGASLLLPISNPVNVMIGESAHLPLRQFIGLLWLPSLLAGGLTAGSLWFAFGHGLRRRFDETRIAPFDGDPRYRSEVAAMLLLTAFGLVAVTAADGFVGVAACVAAAIMGAHGALRRRLDARQVLRNANPTIVILVAALFALAEGLLKSGLLAAPLTAVVAFSGKHPGLAAPLTALASAAGSNVFNNLPTAALVSVALRHASMTTAVAHRIAAGAMVGCDLGPNFTTVGSLSTLLWVVLLRRRGLEISPLEYARAGLLVAPLAVAASVVALFVTAR